MASAKVEKEEYTEKIIQLKHANTERKRNEINFNEKLSSTEQDKVRPHSKVVKIQQG